eukprot:SAG22_NODE_3876_length_1486_cov_1.233598_3_plen_52_part_00
MYECELKQKGLFTLETSRSLPFFPALAADPKDRRVVSTHSVFERCLGSRRR